jgi:hypothetical protein
MVGDTGATTLHFERAEAGGGETHTRTYTPRARTLTDGLGNMDECEVCIRCPFRDQASEDQRRPSCLL